MSQNELSILLWILHAHIENEQFSIISVCLFEQCFQLPSVANIIIILLHFSLFQFLQYRDNEPYLKWPTDWQHYKAIFNLHHWKTNLMWVSQIICIICKWNLSYSGVDHGQIGGNTMGATGRGSRRDAPPSIFSEGDIPLLNSKEEKYERQIKKRKKKNSTNCP